MQKLRKNHHYLGTLLFIAILLICHFAINDNIQEVVAKEGMMNVLLSPFRFDSDDHSILGVLPFFIVSIFLEKHYGSFNYLLMILLGIPLVSLTNLTIVQAGVYKGLDLLNYFLVGIFLVTVIFNYKDYRSNYKRAILPILVVALIMALSSWNITQVLNVKEIESLLEFDFLCHLKNSFNNRTALFVGAIIGFLSKIMNNVGEESNGW